MHHKVHLDPLGITIQVYTICTVYIYIEHSLSVIVYHSRMMRKLQMKQRHFDKDVGISFMAGRGRLEQNKHTKVDQCNIFLISTFGRLLKCLWAQDISKAFRCHKTVCFYGGL